MHKINVCFVYSKKIFKYFQTEGTTFYLFSIAWLNMVYIKLLKTYNSLYSFQLQRTQAFCMLKNVKYFGVLLLLF